MCGSKELKLLNNDNFTKISSTNLDFVKDVHSWKWCWASGKRYMVVGLGVSYSWTSVTHVMRLPDCQRGEVSAWDMKGTPSFTARRELQGLELPKGTVLEVEVVSEMIGEVSCLATSQVCSCPCACGRWDSSACTR